MAQTQFVCYRLGCRPGSGRPRVFSLSARPLVSFFCGDAAMNQPLGQKPSTISMISGGSARLFCMGPWVRALATFRKLSAKKKLDRGLQGSSACSKKALALVCWPASDAARCRLFRLSCWSERRTRRTLALSLASASSPSLSQVAASWSQQKAFFFPATRGAARPGTLGQKALGLPWPQPATATGTFPQLWSGPT